MTYSVYISSDDIQVIKGSANHNDMVQIEQYTSLPLTAGCMINGVITDAKAIEDELISLKEDGMTSCRLVIDSGQILIKNVIVPFMKPKQLLALCEQELSDLKNKEDELIYDYSVLSRKNGQEKNGEILCCGIEQKLLESYMELFEQAGIALQAIDISINVIHKLTQEMSCLQDRSYILVILDGNNMTSLMFEHNHYVLSSRARLFANRGTTSYVAEIGGNISQMLQFAKSQQHDEDIKYVYFAQLQEDELTLIPNYVKDNLSMEADVFPQEGFLHIKKTEQNEGFQLQQYILSVAGLFHD